MLMGRPAHVWLWHLMTAWALVGVALIVLGDWGLWHFYILTALAVLTGGAWWRYLGKQEGKSRPLANPAKPESLP